MITEPMIKQNQTEAENDLDLVYQQNEYPKITNEPFYRMGFALQELRIALLKMGQAYDQGWVDSLELHRQLEKLTHRQRLAIWVLDTAEQLANWIEGNNA